jgi:hypothetical protein
MWRPSYECEVAIVSNAEFGSGSNPDMSQNNAVRAIQKTSAMLDLDMMGVGQGHRWSWPKFAV